VATGAPAAVAKNGLTEGATYLKFAMPTALGATVPPVALQVGTVIVTWYVTVRGA